MRIRVTDMFPHLWDVRLQWCASYPNKDAVPMTKAETIMRREEALNIRQMFFVHTDTTRITYKTDVYIEGIGVVSWPGYIPIRRPG